MHRLNVPDRAIVHALLPALMLGALAGCGGAPAQTVVIVTAQERTPRLEFDGLRLLMSEGEAQGWARDNNFTHNIDTDGAASQTASIQPHNHVVKRYDLKFEDSLLISLTNHYVAADPKRSDARKHYARKRLRLDGSWVMADGARQTIVMVNRDGNQLVAVHAGKARNRNEVDAMFELLLKEKPIDRPAVPEVDPKAGDAHL